MYDYDQTWDIIWYIAHDEKRMTKLATDKGWDKVDGIIIAACREAKVKMKNVDRAEVRHQLFKMVKELA